MNHRPYGVSFQVSWPNDDPHQMENLAALMDTQAQKLHKLAKKTRKLAAKRRRGINLVRVVDAIKRSPGINNEMLINTVSDLSNTEIYNALGDAVKADLIHNTKVGYSGIRRWYPNDK